MSSIRIYNVERRRGPPGLEGPDTPAVNFAKRRLLFFRSCVEFWGGEKATGWTTDQSEWRWRVDDVTSKTLVIFLLSLCKRGASGRSSSSRLSHWHSKALGQISLGQTWAPGWWRRTHQPPLSGTTLAVAKDCFSFPFFIQPSPGHPDLRFSPTPPFLPQRQRKPRALFAHWPRAGRVQEKCHSECCCCCWLVEQGGACEAAVKTWTPAGSLSAAGCRVLSAAPAPAALWLHRLSPLSMGHHALHLSALRHHTLT